MIIPRLPVGARTNPGRFYYPTKEKEIHHFIQTYETGQYTPRRLRSELYIFTKTYTSVLGRHYKAEWVELSELSEFDISTRTGLQVTDLTVEPGGGFTCLLSKDEPVLLYWPVLDSILVLNSKKEGWTDQDKEIRIMNYLFTNVLG
tara:strand:+ start:434 stop:871 length:438 start_codon:yes stop_codon:yes gene_type:complete